MDADALDGISDAANEKIASQRAGQAERGAAEPFLIKVVDAEIPQIAMKKVHTELELFPQEPRLDKRRFIVLAPGANLNPEPCFLPASHEPGRMKQIKISLGHFHKSQNAVHRAEPRAELQMPGRGLPDRDQQVLAIGYLSRLGLSIDGLK